MLSVIRLVSFFTSLISAPISVRIFSVIFKSTPKSSLRFKREPSDCTEKSPSDIFFMFLSTAFKGFVILVIIYARNKIIAVAKIIHIIRKTWIFWLVNLSALFLEAEIWSSMWSM